MRLRASFWPALLALTCGCSVIVGSEVDDLEPNLNGKRDVTVSLRDFGPHLGQLLQIQLVENFSLLPVEDRPPEGTIPPVAAQIVANPVPSNCLDFRLRRGAPFLANRVDFYADLNMNFMLDPPSAGDHSWRRELDEDGSLVFIHDVQFDDLTTDPGAINLNPFRVNISGADAHEGAVVVAFLTREEILDAEGNVRQPTVPAMFVGQVQSGQIDFTLEDAADPGVDYDVVLRIGDRALDCRVSGLVTPVAAGEPLLVEGALDSLTCEAGSQPDCDGLETMCETGDRAACNELAWECAFVDCAR